MTPSLSRRAALAAGAGLLAAARPARAAGFPSGPVTYIIGYAPGGLSDVIARLIGDEITREHHQQVLLDYRPGAGGGLAADVLARTKPDGHTLMAATNSHFAIIPLLNSVRYEPIADLLPAALVGDAYMAIVVNPSVPARTLPELIAYAKANPGKLNFGSAGQGTVGHLSGEYLKKRTGIDIQHVPYRGSPPAVQACLANEVQVIFGPEGADAHLAGDLRAIAILGQDRWSKLPEVPTTEESGLPGWALRSWHTVGIHGRTPPALLEEVHDVLAGIIAQPKLQQRFEQMGLKTGRLSLAELRQRAEEDAQLFGTLIREVGLGRG
ncbi:tripartite tricarboxylate transporter substrate binding protein [Roseomonas sp. OT10]|uniref:tripartite tricarboxylate transporter substrate binding protein n=1 Tax=Roseomonas cutis TaxID=2897332 RepID=UPI001E2CFFEE|nr:tripartite tricarboxylate transporter substrate binding protein [Roseomonas sp. OT10]UFN51302.1 tripartite tricarboxylate transporter substrate binding protein [Roseomonas sp. OT10]